MFFSDLDHTRLPSVFGYRKLSVAVLLLALAWTTPAMAIDYMVNVQLYNGNKFNDNLDDGLNSISDLGNKTSTDGAALTAKNTLRTIGRGYNGVTLSFLMGFDEHYFGLGLGFYSLGTTTMTFSLIDSNDDTKRTDRLDLEAQTAVLRLEYYYKIPISKTFSFMPGTALGLYPLQYTIFIENTNEDSRASDTNNEIGVFAISAIALLVYDWNSWFSINFGLGVTLSTPSDGFSVGKYNFVYQGDNLKVKNSAGDNATVGLSGIDFRLGAAFRW